VTPVPHIQTRFPTGTLKGGHLKFVSDINWGVVIIHPVKSKCHIFLLLSLLLISGCATTGSRVSHNLVLENKSSRQMYETVLLIGDNQFAFGFMEAPFVKVVGGYLKPLTGMAQLSWHSNGLEREETIGLSSIVPPGTPGSVIFTVFDDRVVARFEAESNAPK
jgi:hypothetical protein